MRLWQKQRLRRRPRKKLLPQRQRQKRLQQKRRCPRQRRHRRLPPRILSRKLRPPLLPLPFHRLRRRPDRMVAEDLSEGFAQSGERTRPRVLFSAPRRKSSGKVRDDEGVIASARGRMRSPELSSMSRRFITLILVLLAFGIEATGA